MILLSTLPGVDPSVVCAVAELALYWNLNLRETVDHFHCGVKALMLAGPAAFPNLLFG